MCVWASWFPCKCAVTVKERCWLQPEGQRVWACVAAQQESLSSGRCYLWRPSFYGVCFLHGRLAHSRGIGDGHIWEGETAGVKAIFWPEEKSGGVWVVGASESRGLETALQQAWAHIPLFSRHSCRNSNEGNRSSTTSSVQQPFYTFSLVVLCYFTGLKV